MQMGAADSDLHRSVFFAGSALWRVPKGAARGAVKAQQESAGRRVIEERGSHLRCSYVPP